MKMPGYLIFFGLFTAVTGFALDLVRLDSWISPSRRDTYTTSNPLWIGNPGETRSPDYGFGRVDGRVFSPHSAQPADTLALHQWFSPSRGDNYLTTHPAWIGGPGDTRSPDYRYSRMEGYVFDRALAGTIPLKGWYNSAANDNYATSVDPIWANNTSYTFSRIEGFMFPQTNNQPPFSAEYFGYGTMRGHGARALGGRSVLILLQEFSDVRFTSAHTTTYYRNLFFSSAARSVAGYYLWNSYFNFLWSEADVLKVSIPDDPATPGVDESRWATWNGGGGTVSDFDRRVLTAADNAGVNFAYYDDNGDGRLTADELALFIINADPLPGANCGQARPQSGFALDGVQIDLFGAAVSQAVGFGTLCHELAHQLGAIDIYGARGRLNTSNSCMAATCGRDDVHEYYHLDAWHKMRLGWIEPRIFPLSYPGACAYLDAPQKGGWNVTDNKRPILLFDPARQTNKIKEYFLLEYRVPTPPDRDGYEADVAGTGVVIWWIRTGQGTDDFINFETIWHAGDGLQSSVASGSDDQAVDWTFPANGVNDTIVPGTDFVLQSTPTGNDITRNDPSMIAYGRPGAWGFGAPWTQSSTPTALRYFDGTDSGFQLRFGEISSGSQTISVEWNMDELPLRLDEVIVPSDSRASPGTTITVTGMFGVSKRAGRSLTLTSGTSHYDLYVSSWKPDRIQAYINIGIPPGDYRLTCYSDFDHLIAGNSLPFRVVNPPHLDLTRGTTPQRLQLNLKGDLNSIYILEEAKDLSGPWNPIYTNPAPFSYTLPPIGQLPARFFRASEMQKPQ